jgi:hypothetical protein
MKNVIDFVEQAFVQQALNRAVMPVRTCIPVEKNKGGGRFNHPGIRYHESGFRHHYSYAGGKA